MRRRSRKNKYEEEEEEKIGLDTVCPVGDNDILLKVTKYMKRTLLDVPIVEPITDKDSKKLTGAFIVLLS